MIKNNKGITILALVITVIILAMLVGVSLNSGYSVINNMRAGRMISDMVLVKAKVQTIYEQYEFNEEKGLIGTRIDKTMLPSLIQTEKESIKTALDDNTWFQWDTNTLVSQGLDYKLLGEGEYFYVNYKYSEIIYSKGTIYEGQTYYSLTGLNNAYKNSQ